MKNTIIFAKHTHNPTDYILAKHEVAAVSTGGIHVEYGIENPTRYTPKIIEQSRNRWAIVSLVEQKEYDKFLEPLMIPLFSKAMCVGNRFKS